MGGIPNKRPIRPVRWLQRMVLGAMMTFVAFVLEKRLLKALRKERRPLPGDEAEPAAEQDRHANLTTGRDRASPAARR